MSYSAIIKVEKCRLTILCIKFVEQQNAPLMDVMMIADESFLVDMFDLYFFKLLKLEELI